MLKENEFPPSEIRTKSFEDSIFRDTINNRTRIIEYQPGNGTRYLFSLNSLEDLSPEILERCGVTKDTFVISLITDPKNVRSLLYSKHMLIDTRLVEQLGMGPADTEVIGEFLAHLFGKKWLR